MLLASAALFAGAAQPPAAQEPVPPSQAPPRTSPSAPTSAQTSPVEGPIRWLMTSRELRQARTLGSPGEVVGYLEAFWRQRDPRPDEAHNPFRQRFFQRVADADLLYTEEITRGSLTARGRGYILLGPPSRLTQRYERAPEVDLTRARGGRPGSSLLLVETWAYRPEDLPAELRRVLTATGWSVELELRFTAEGGRYTLRQGTSLLDLAARSLVPDDGLR